jgi:hypothetical protein
MGAPKPARSASECLLSRARPGCPLGARYATSAGRTSRPGRPDPERATERRDRPIPERRFRSKSRAGTVADDGWWLGS